MDVVITTSVDCASTHLLFPPAAGLATSVSTSFLFFPYIIRRLMSNPGECLTTKSSGLYVTDVVGEDSLFNSVIDSTTNFPEESMHSEPLQETLRRGNSRRSLLNLSRNGHESLISWDDSVAHEKIIGPVQVTKYHSYIQTLSFAKYQDGPHETIMEQRTGWTVAKSCGRFEQPDCMCGSNGSDRRSRLSSRFAMWAYNSPSIDWPDYSFEVAAPLM